MVFIKDKRGQGAIEYLLMIAGAVVVAVVVIVLIQGMATSGETQALDAQYNAEVQTAKIGAVTHTNKEFTAPKCFSGGSVFLRGVELPNNTIIPKGTYFPANIGVPGGGFTTDGGTLAEGVTLPKSSKLDSDLTITPAYTLQFDLIVPSGTKLEVANNLVLSATQTAYTKVTPYDC